MMTSRRIASLKRMLNARLLELQASMRDDVREGHGRSRADHGADSLEQSEADVQRDITLSLLRMRSETIGRIAAALARIDAGAYGACAECEREISEARLRALPFAVRCQECEEEREQTQRASERLAKRAGVSLPSGVMRT
jgi:DnaK suppressor protein